jgi:hypothetical protein
MSGKIIKTTSSKPQKLTCIICNKHLSINTNDHKCHYRNLSENIILNK